MDRKITLVVLVVSFVVLFKTSVVLSASSCDCDDNYGFSCIWHCRFSSCPISLISSKVEEKLQQVVGQEEAMDLIKDNLFFSTSNNAKILHFFGSNGVGKSLAAQLIIESVLSQDPARQSKGSFIIHGNDLNRLSEIEIDNLILNIFQKIESCPHLFIVVEEGLEVPLPFLKFIETLAADSSVRKWIGNSLRTVRTKDVTIIITSDFGPKMESEESNLDEINKQTFFEILEHNPELSRISQLSKMIYFNRMPRVKASELTTKTLPHSVLQAVKSFPGKVVSDFDQYSSHKVKMASHEDLKRLALDVYQQTLNDPTRSLGNFRGLQQKFEEIAAGAIKKAFKSIPSRTRHQTILCKHDGNQISCSVSPPSQYL